MNREQEIKLENAVSTAEIIEAIDLLRIIIYQISHMTMAVIKSDEGAQQLLEEKIDLTESSLESLRQRLYDRTLIDMRK